MGLFGLLSRHTPIERLSKTVINLLEKDGWAVYECNDGSLEGIDDLRAIVQNGRERNLLEEGKKYRILPLIKEDDKALEVYMALNHMRTNPTLNKYLKNNNRAEIIKNTGTKYFSEINGNYQIESIILEGDNLKFVIDKTRFRMFSSEICAFLKDSFIEAKGSDIKKSIKCINKYEKRNCWEPNVSPVTNIMTYN